LIKTLAATPRSGRRKRQLIPLHGAERACTAALGSGELMAGGREIRSLHLLGRVGVSSVCKIVARGAASHVECDNGRNR